MTHVYDSSTTKKITHRPDNLTLLADGPASLSPTSSSPGDSASPFTSSLTLNPPYCQASGEYQVLPVWLVATTFFLVSFPRSSSSISPPLNVSRTSRSSLGPSYLLLWSSLG